MTDIGIVELIGHIIKTWVISHVPFLETQQMSVHTAYSDYGNSVLGATPHCTALLSVHVVADLNLWLI